MGSRPATLTRHLAEESQRLSSGELSFLLTEISLAARVISREVNRAALVGKLGYTGEMNVQGEQVKKLDVWSNEVFAGALEESRLVCTMVSEEMEQPLHIDGNCAGGRYVVCFDPVDGSSNLDINGTVGTIFSILRRRGQGRDHVAADALQKGSEQVAAGYVMYGTSTVLVYAAGSGVRGFTLDQTIGEFIRSHDDIRIPRDRKSTRLNSSHIQKSRMPSSA